MEPWSHFNSFQKKPDTGMNARLSPLQRKFLENLDRHFIGRAH